MRTIFFCVLTAFTLLACSSGGNVPPELEKAAAVVEATLKPAALEQSSFPVVLPNGTPREFVSWYFSTLGIAEWPPHEDDPDAEIIPGIKIPRGVSYFHSAPNIESGKQVVVKWDDSSGMVIVEGYTDPQKKPVFVKEWLLPAVTAKNEMARLTAQSLLEQGASFQAF